MNWFKNIAHGISRAFTIPRAVQQKLKQNPVVQAELPIAIQKAQDAIAGHFAGDPVAGAVANEILALGLRQVGIR